MTTDALEHQGPTPSPAAARLGGLAAASPIVLFLAWALTTGWTDRVSGFPLTLAMVSIGAVVAGWITGQFVDYSLLRGLIGLVLYPVVGWLVVMPINVVGSTWVDLQSGRVSDAAALLASASGYLLYGTLSSAYAFIYLMPLGVGWVLTFVLIRPVVER